MADCIGMQINAKQLGDALNTLVRDLSASLETPPSKSQLLAMRAAVMRASHCLDALNREIKAVAIADGSEM